MDDFYAKNKDYFIPPESRFRGRFQIEKSINLCSIGILRILLRESEIQISFQTLSDSNGKPIVASNSSVDQWKQEYIQKDKDFHLLAWPTDKSGKLLSVDFLKERALDKFLFDLDLSKVKSGDKFQVIFGEMERFLGAVKEVIKKIKPENPVPLSALSSEEKDLLNKLNKFTEADSFPNLLENTTQAVLDVWKAFLENGYLDPENAQRKIFMDHILSQEIKDELTRLEVEKYSHFLGVSLEDYIKSDEDIRTCLDRFRPNSLGPNPKKEQHSETLFTAWIEHNRSKLEETISPPEITLIYFLYTHKSTCKNCEELSYNSISRTPISRTPFLISFSEIFKNNGVENFSDITDLSLNLEDFKRLSGEEKPSDIHPWKGIVRIPVQYQM
ncbi:MAG: hypothetical protein J0H12_07395 [Candidatus Paracaedimonas acanthamoebae]|uniref:Uncharacterized protein n=1 Tax=Candidatus Paracaedimonas acanthamoebae TaxID=244581 RepID=A0A8J7PN52_9PROT|nr:hypothetical protein [Candidatus Paracaedimonas acanthamoebae]